MRITHLARGALACATLLAPRPSLAQDVEDPLSVHGYLTQGFAATDGLATMGIDRDGTTDYRRAALLLRYAMSGRSNFAVQVAHRRLGASPTQAFDSDVKLDWGFYEHKFADMTKLRVGRAPLPIGIHNETRYVGTLLPFYRAPFAVYNEGAFVAEAIDGLTASHTLFANSSFAATISAYGGSYGFLESGAIFQQNAPPAVAVKQARAQRVLGGWLWLATPLDGLRLGGGAQRHTKRGGLYRTAEAREGAFESYGALDGTFDRVVVRSEYRTERSDGATYHGYYAQAGTRVVGGLWVHGQMERARLKLAATPFAAGRDIRDFNRDDAVSFNYAFTPTLLLKVEGHRARGFNTDAAIDRFRDPARRGRYVISSLSVAF